MAAHEETEQALENVLKRIGQEFRIVFHKFSTETFSQGGYKSGKWTYNLTSQKVSLDYWFSSFSSRKEEAEITYSADGDEQKLEADLREALSRLRQTVNRKKGMF